MWMAATVEEFRRQRQMWRGKVALVPTMGALHEGHLSLVRRGRELADHVAVSIFVNPTQFGPSEDFQSYPRPLEQDLDLCRRAGVEGVLVPSVEAMYPPTQPACDVQVPDLARELEGAVRPGHFAGVCRIVAKLLNIAQPDIACFGLKDYQQYRIVAAMVADLCMPVRIEPCPTLREADGLAMSSRNVYLTADQRPCATGLHKALCTARAMVEIDGEPDPLRVEQAMRQVMIAHQITPDYAVLRHPLWLTPLDAIEPALTGGVVALVAGRLGKVRLLDNMLLACS